MVEGEGVGPAAHQVTLGVNPKYLAIQLLIKCRKVVPTESLQHPEKWELARQQPALTILGL